MSSSGGLYQYVGDDPAQVESALFDLGHVGASLGALAGEVGHDMASIKASWPGGHTGQVAAADAARMGEALGECHEVFARAERALSELYPVLVTGRRRVDDLNDAHQMLAGAANSFAGVRDADLGNRGRQEHFIAVEDALQAAKARSGFDSLVDIESAYAKVKALVAEETTNCTTVLKRLTAEGSAPVGHAVGESKYTGPGFFALLAAGSDSQVADILARRTAFPTDPDKVHEAWQRLSPDQRQDLLAGDPKRFGNLNGIPAVDRNTANMATLKDQLARLAAGLKAAGIEATTDPNEIDGRFDMGRFAIMERVSGLTLREARQALLLDYQLAANGKAGAQLLAYEPGAYGGKGRAAIVYGDLDHADNIAVNVPGLRSGLHNIDDVAGDALHLYKQALKADLGRHTAVVAWQGYDTPQELDVLYQDAAKRGSQLLAADVNAMRATHDGPLGMLTVVAHSYGSTTAGLALQRENLKVDQVVLIGSPGVGGDAKSAADLNLLPSQVFVGSASRDIVTTGTDSLGEDPAEDSFGATRFKAESVQRSWHASFSDHSLYFDEGNHSESLYSLANIATGHADRLGPDGMLAAPRYTEMTGIGYEDSEVVVDPEAARTPTAGHDHTNDPRSTSP